MRKLIAFILKIQKKRALRKLRRRGLTPEQAAAEGVVSGRVWEDFCDTLKSAGGSILGFDSPDDPLTRAEGFRYLSRLVRAGLENFMEAGTPKAPTLRRLVHETVKMGNDNPDFFYRSASVDGRYEYRIAGTLGTTPFLVLSTQEGDYTENDGARMPLAGQLDSRDMVVDPDGGVEIILSREKRTANWLRMTPETKMVMIRELSGDRERETPADLRIERIGGSPGPEPFTAKRLEEGLSRTGMLVSGASLMFARWSRDFAKTVNTLPRFDQAKSDAAGGDPEMAYYHSYWRLADDEALIIETPVPECTTWNCVLSNHWLESLDYRYDQIHVNKHIASYRPDGSVRIVVAHSDPGLPNWLTTQGHRFGSICFRWSRADSHPEPGARVVKTTDLESLRVEEAAEPSRRLTYEPARTGTGSSRTS